MDDTICPGVLPDIGEKSYLWVYKNKEDFVHFCVTDMKSPTGFWKDIQEYFIMKLKDEPQNTTRNN